MFASLFKGILAFVLGITIGAGCVGKDAPADSELKQKVQDHMDVIADESAAMIDDVMDEVRKNEHVQEAEKFVDDVNEIIGNTVDDINQHFGQEEEAVTEESVTEEETEGTL